MNFYKELENECINAGISGKVTSVPDELKPTSKDYAELNKNIEEKLEVNNEMLILSEQYASKCMPVGETKILKDCRTCVNPSCRVESYEKPVSDCFGWENPKLSSLNKILTKKMTNK